MTQPRIGFGYDAHRFTTGDHIDLGGIRIPHTHGLEAHSDGDVLLHAIGDALLGAAAMGDLGQHFPDTSEVWRDASSSDLITEILAKLSKAGFVVGNIDTTIIAEAPRLSAYRRAMQDAVAGLLSITPHQVSIKATTNESMGWIGRKEGIAVHAVALIFPQQAAHQ